MPDKKTLKFLAEHAPRAAVTVKIFRIVSQTRGYEFDTSKCQPDRYDDPKQSKIIEIVDGRIVGVRNYVVRRRAEFELRELFVKFERQGNHPVKTKRDEFTVEASEEKI